MQRKTGQTGKNKSRQAGNKKTARQSNPKNRNVQSEFHQSFGHMLIPKK